MTKDILCIYCKIEELAGDLSDEHIIPQVLGGTIAIPAVCKEHNERLGYELESDLKRNAFIVAALRKLEIQPPDLAHHEAEVKIKLDDEQGLKGYIDKKGEPKFFPQDSKLGHTVIPENQTVEVLQKQVERFEKKTGKKIKFNFGEFDQLPYNIAIPIFGTDIVFIKRKPSSGTVIIHGLDRPIPFRVIAKIALTHLTALDYRFALKDEFDAIKSYILHGGRERFIMLHTFLRDVKPTSIEYLPFHYVRISLIEGALVAIVDLFGAIKFMVFFEEFSNVEEFQPKEFLDNYHVYDIKRQTIFFDQGDEELREWDDMLLGAVAAWGKYEKKHPGENS